MQSGAEEVDEVEADEYKERLARHPAGLDLDFRDSSRGCVVTTVADDFDLDRIVSCKETSFETCSATMNQHVRSEMTALMNV